MLLIDAGVGSDLNDWDAHIEKAIRFIRKEKPDLAEKELDNLRQNVYFVQSAISPKYLAFACLVKSVDGTEYNDMTADGLQKVLDLLPLVGSGADIFRTNTFCIFGKYVWSPYLLVTVPILIGIFCMPFAVRNWSRRMKV